jgi:hypothetical protein
MPAVIEAQNSHKDASTAYLLAASQALALGPLLGLSQSLVLRKVTSRWAWWIGANLVSWLIVDAVVYLLSQVFGGLNVLTGDGSIAEVYLTLIATTPLTGRALLWVLAPSPWPFPGRRSRHDKPGRGAGPGEEPPADGLGAAALARVGRGAGGLVLPAAA